MKKIINEYFDGDRDKVLIIDGTRQVREADILINDYNNSTVLSLEIKSGKPNPALERFLS